MPRQVPQAQIVQIITRSVAVLRTAGPYQVQLPAGPVACGEGEMLRLTRITLCLANRD